MTLASDLHWLISEGYVIEFNDGSLDLPRTKPVLAVAPAEKADEGIQAAAAPASVEDTGNIPVETQQTEPLLGGEESTEPVSASANVSAD
jgi:hypothetical protein